MRCKRVLFGLAALILGGCAAGAPQAPMGFRRHPANSPETIAGLLRRHPDPAAEPQAAPAPARIEPPPPSSTTALEGTSVIVVSDFSAPGGVGALPAQSRSRLVASARQARSVRLYCRGDQLRPSRAGFMALVRRGLAVKAFLVAQGVSAGKIHVYARSAGGFVADNATVAGRAENRRVEIHFA
jgi:hypothetical protein